MAYTTAKLVQQEIRADTPFGGATEPSLTTVNNWIDEATAEIELATGEIFSSSIVSSEYVDYDGSGVLQLPKFPLISVDEIRYNRNSHTTSSTDWVTLSEGMGEHYLVYLDYGEIEFIGGNSNATPITPKAGKQRLCLTYTHGRNSTPLEIQRWATLSVAKRAISSLLHSQANSEGGEVSVGPITVKDPSNFGLNHIKSINTELDRIISGAGQQFRTYRIDRRY